MKRLLRRWPELAALVLLGATLPAAAALAPTEWRHRQTLAVPAAGVVRIHLPDATFDAALPTLQDLRLLDPHGTELPLLLDLPPPAPARRLPPRNLTTRLVDGATVITLETGTASPLDSLALATPAPFFLRPAKIEASPDGSSWTEIDAGVPLFRQWGAEQLTLPLGGRSAAHLRITVADGRGGPLTFSGANLLLAAGPAAEPLPVGARLTAREEFAGETLLTVTLDGRHVPLTALELDTPEPLFMRRVTVAVREVQGSTTVERLIGHGTVYRVALDGAPARTGLRIPVSHLPTQHDLLVRIENGDSPPLAVTGLRLHRQPVQALFHAPAAGTYQLLSGNPQASAPRYDLAAFADDLRAARAPVVTPGPLEPMPDYAPRAGLAGPALPDIPLTGAPLDASAWPRRKTVTPAAAGVQELELDPAALAGARGDLADLRLLRDGRQIPYVLERTDLARGLALAPEPATDPRRPSVSTWVLKLPHAALPLRRIVVTTSTPLFRREFRLYEKDTAPNGRTYERPLGGGSWSRTPDPGSPATRVLDLTDRPRTDTLYLETDDGDNPPLDLTSVRADHPVVRLVFKTADATPLALAYGHTTVSAPRYDLSLVAGRLLTAPRQRAVLGAEETDEAGFLRGALGGLRGGPVFWGALALVVVVLLAVVARLLPKPAEASAKSPRR